ncbi:MAG: ribulose-bisphosphate carboxylase large subunit [Patescibacteria group bacterium]|nr:ribulose-bisphosphate carboxylase large subunit [Patescibacteria group bacterium]
MYNLDYIKLNKKYDQKNYIHAEFYMESTLSDKQAAAALATESSIGTWTKVSTMEKKKFKKLAARVYEISKKYSRIKVAYPLDLFEKGNIPQLLSSVAGNIYSLKEITSLRLINLHFPPAYIKSFPGPAFGQKGIRKVTQVKNRPLIGVIIKPKLGLSPARHAQVAYQVLKNGADLVKDDENLTNQKFNPFKKRVKKTLEKVKKIEKTSETKKLVAFNVTASTPEMIERAKFVKKHGGRCIMIDLVTAGFSGLQALREANLGLIIHGHRAMHSAFTRGSQHGLDYYVLAKLARLAGIDELHSGTIVGKMAGNKEEVLKVNKFLNGQLYGLKKTMPVSSGGLHPGLVEKLIKLLGQNIIINFGGGVHGHPDGSAEGMKAAWSAVKAVSSGLTLKKAAKKSPSLKKAIEFFK